MNMIEVVICVSERPDSMTCGKVVSFATHSDSDLILQVEACDLFGGFVTAQSMAGGTGSGLGKLRFPPRPCSMF